MSIRNSILTAAALGFLATATAQAKDCTELKSEIEAQFQAKGVSNYSLDVVAAADAAGASGKIIGSCDGGANKLVYARGGSGAAPSTEAAPAPAAAAPTPAKPAKPPKTSAPPPLGNY